MWQKPARAVLNAHHAFQSIIGFVFFCVFSGGLGFLLRHCVSEKVDWPDKISLAFLSVSMAIVYGFHIYGMLAAQSLPSHRWFCGLKLLFWLVSFLVGLFIVART
jgi:hypothetical protein